MVRHRSRATPGSLAGTLVDSQRLVQTLRPASKRCNSAQRLAENRCTLRGGFFRIQLCVSWSFPPLLISCIVLTHITRPLKPSCAWVSKDDPRSAGLDYHINLSVFPLGAYLQLINLRFWYQGLKIEPPPGGRAEQGWLAPLDHDAVAVVALGALLYSAAVSNSLAHTRSSKTSPHLRAYAQYTYLVCGGGARWTKRRPSDVPSSSLG